MGRERVGAVGVVTVGFASGADGRGIAYAKVWSNERRSQSIVRVEFSSNVRPALHGRDVAYAAIERVARELFATGLHNVELRCEDASLVTDLSERRTVPAALQMPYIALRCTLNRFTGCSVVACDDGTARDLAARARAEVSFDIAA